MNQSVSEMQNEFFDIVKKAIEKGKQEETTLMELVEELKADLRMFENNR